MSFELILGNNNQCFVTAGVAKQTESLDSVCYLCMCLIPYNPQELSTYLILNTQHL